MKEVTGFREPDSGDLRSRLRAYFFAVRLTRRGLFPVALVLTFLGMFLAVQALAPRTRDGLLHPLTPLLAGARVGPLIREGEWWRVLASLFLHADVLHLTVNCIGAWFLAQLSENIFGTSRAVLLFLWGGVAGAAASALWTPLASVGASGAIFALLGALQTFAVVRRRAIPGPLRRVLLLGVCLWLVAAFWQGGGSHSVDQAAHLGGLVAGALGSLAFGADLPVFSLGPRPAPRPLRVAAAASILVSVLALAMAVWGLVEGPSPARPAFARLELGRAEIPIPATWPHGRLSGTCHLDPTPVRDLLRTSVVCFRDPYGTLFLVGRVGDVFGGRSLDPLLTFEHGHRAFLRMVDGDVVQRVLPLERQWAVALVGYEVIERRYDAFLDAVVDGVLIRPDPPRSP